MAGIECVLHCSRERKCSFSAGLSLWVANELIAANHSLVWSVPTFQFPIPVEVKDQLWLIECLKMSRNELLAGISSSYAEKNIRKSQKNPIKAIEIYCKLIYFWTKAAICKLSHANNRETEIKLKMELKLVCKIEKSMRLLCMYVCQSADTIEMKCKGNLEVLIFIRKLEISKEILVNFWPKNIKQSVVNFK